MTLRNWAPHPKSMSLLRLAGLVASMPSWFALIINQDELELNPPPAKGSTGNRLSKVSSRRSTSQ
jgi:hypothetical protein